MTELSCSQLCSAKIQWIANTTMESENSKWATFWSLWRSSNHTPALISSSLTCKGRPVVCCYILNLIWLVHLMKFDVIFEPLCILASKDFSYIIANTFRGTKDCCSFFELMLQITEWLCWLLRYQGMLSSHAVHFTIFWGFAELSVWMWVLFGVTCNQQGKIDSLKTSSMCCMFFLHYVQYS